MDALPLAEHLGTIAKIIDEWLDRNPGGKVVVCEANRFRYKGNWKLAYDNSCDGYHVAYSHRSLLETENRFAGENAKGMAYYRNSPDTQPMYMRYTGHGNHFKDKRPNLEQRPGGFFARPDSNIAGVNVHTARKSMGRMLAKEAPAEADVVVGVPNSSLSAASGYAEQSGIPYEMGLVKNQYIARTFIQPTQALRELGVRMKLSAVSGVVKGKKVVVIDDSIVRGTTSKYIVQLLRDAGAVEVHMRIASPPFRFPDFYGIDVQDRKHLIAADHSVEEIREIIGVDSLAFLSVTGTIDSIGLNFDAPYKGLCMAYFTGEYPTPLYDYEADYMESLKSKKN